MAQETIKTTNALKDGKVKKQQPVTVYGTAASKMQTGKAYEVHEELAKKLVENGMATMENPNETKDSKPSKDK